MKVVFTDYGLLGRMPDGQWRLFVSEAEYAEAYADENQ